MEMALIVAQQVAVVFLLILVGVGIEKKQMITKEGIGQLTHLLLWVVTPCLLVNAYQREYNPHLAKGLVLAIAASVLSHGVGMILGHLVFRKEPSNQYRVNIFCSVYSNCGYMAIPLLTAALGTDGVFYGAAYLAMFTILYWTHGVYVYTGGDKKQISLKKAILNPGVLGTVFSMLLFFGKIKLPTIITDSVGHIANLNTPIAMIILGSYLSRLNFLKVFQNYKMFLVCFLRLILVPLITIGIVKGLQLEETVARAVMICAACPTATVSTLFAHKYGMDATYSSEVVSVYTLLSIITIPLMIVLYQL